MFYQRCRRDWKVQRKAYVQTLKWNSIQFHYLFETERHWHIYVREFDEKSSRYYAKIGILVHESQSLLSCPILVKLDFTYSTYEYLLP